MIQILLAVIAIAVILHAEPAMNRMKCGKTPALLFLAVWCQAISAVALLWVVANQENYEYPLVGMVVGLVVQLLIDRRAHARLREIGTHRTFESRRG